MAGRLRKFTMHGLLCDRCGELRAMLPARGPKLSVCPLCNGPLAQRPYFVGNGVTRQALRLVRTWWRRARTCEGERISDFGSIWHDHDAAGFSERNS